MGDLGSIPGSGSSPEKEMATHSSTLAWTISWTEEPNVHGVAKSLSNFTFTFNLLLPTSTHPLNRWGNSGNWQTLFLGAPKSLQMVTAAMKLKDAYSLEEKL